MTVTISQPLLSGGVASISTAVVDPAKWPVVDTRIVGVDDRETIYQFVDSDPEYPTTLRVGSYVKPGVVKQYNHSARLSFPCTRTDSETGEVIVATDSIVIALTTHFKPLPTNAGTNLELLASLFTPYQGGGMLSLAQRITAWGISDATGPD